MDSAVTISSGKSNQVKSFFESPGRYFSRRQVDVTIRAETVEAFTKELSFHEILDLGCGDGSISLPLLNDNRRLTLLDLSSSMTSIARSSVPPELSKNVVIRNEDFMAADFPKASFDLIICLGLVAHVDSPSDFIKKVAGSLKPGGKVILQFIDSKNFVARLGRLTSWLRELAKPPEYTVNRVSKAEMRRLFSSNDLKMVSLFRYGLPPIPGVQKIFGSDTLCSLVHAIYGKAPNNRNGYLGYEFLCLLEKT